jgi:hypothetical protein
MIVSHFDKSQTRKKTNEDKGVGKKEDDDDDDKEDGYP